MTLKIVRTGKWLYGGSVENPVDVISLDYDWWYELARADGQLDEGEETMEFGAEGCLYYVRFREALNPNEPTWVDSYGHRTMEEAMKAAEEKVPEGIDWE